MFVQLIPCKKICEYLSSITGAPVTLSPMARFQCNAQRLGSINNSCSFSPTGALCNGIYVFTLLFMASKFF
jgi:hypothetical protein